MIKHAGLAVTAVLPFICLGHQPAFAIECDGRYQIVQGQPHSTPYCEDNYLAEVARRHGMKVSGQAIRNNPRLKDEVCYVVGSDPQVSDICIGHTPDGPGFRS